MSLVAKVQDHLVDDKFVLSLLSSATGEITGSGKAQTTLPWDSMVEMFGDELSNAVSRLAHSSYCLDLNEEDRRVVDLARSYAQGWRPSSIWD